MLRAVFFGRAVCSATAASLFGRMRRTQFEVSGFILLFALWYYALMDDAVIVPKPCPEVNKVCSVDYLPALLVNSTVTECLYVSDDSAQELFGDSWDGFGGLPDSVIGFVFEYLTVLKQGFWMVAMLVAIAVAASMLAGWPVTVVSRTAPRCFQPFSFCSAALMAAGFWGVIGSLRDSHLEKTGVRGFFEGTAAKNKLCFLSSRFRKCLLPSQVWFLVLAAAALCVVSYTSSQFVCEASAACSLGAFIYFFALVENGLVQAAAAWCVVFYNFGQVVCAASAAGCILGALSYFFALVKYGFALSEGLVVTVSGFFGAKGCVGSALASSGHVLGLRMLSGCGIKFEWLSQFCR